MKKVAFLMALGDRLPSLIFRAKNSAGVTQNLAAATGIVARARHLPSGTEIEPTVTISNAAQGEITVSWAGQYPLLPGLYRIWVVLTFPGGPMTFPSCPDGEDEVLIEVCPT